MAITPVKSIPAAAVSIAGLGVVGNAVLPGENATKPKEFTSTSNLILYGAILGGGAAIGAKWPSYLHGTSTGSGALRGVAAGAAMLGGWAAGELISNKLGT